jgi:integrase
MLPRTMPRKRLGPRMYRRAGRPGWWCSFSDREKHISLGTEDEAEAAERFAVKVRERQGSASLEAGDVPIATIFAVCYEQAKTNHTRKTAYEINLDLTRVAEWLEQHGIFSARKITATTVEDYKTARRFTVGAARINRELTSWKKGMKVAIERKLALPSCLTWFARMREPRPEPHQLKRSRDEIAAFLEVAERLFPDHHALFRTVIGSAIRDDEARHIEPGDVQTPWLVVTPKPPGRCSCCPKGWATKGYRYRRVPISEETAAAALAFMAARDAGRVNMADPKGVWKVMQTCCEASGVPAFSLHQLRHAWATQMFEAGHRLGLISKWLGHADVQTTMRYLGVTEEEAPDAGSLPW